MRHLSSLPPKGLCVEADPGIGPQGGRGPRVPSLRRRLDRGPDEPDVPGPLPPPRAHDPDEGRPGANLPQRQARGEDRQAGPRRSGRFHLRQDVLRHRRRRDDPPDADAGDRQRARPHHRGVRDVRVDPRLRLPPLRPPSGRVGEGPRRAGRDPVRARGGTDPGGAGGVPIPRRRDTRDAEDPPPGGVGDAQGVEDDRRGREADPEGVERRREREADSRERSQGVRGGRQPHGRPIGLRPRALAGRIHRALGVDALRGGTTTVRRRTPVVRGDEGVPRLAREGGGVVRAGTKVRRRQGDRVEGERDAVYHPADGVEVRPRPLAKSKVVEMN
ncbi:hypothetical protein ACHAWF_008109 [Thalassiosira exigua]